MMRGLKAILIITTLLIFLSSCKMQQGKNEITPTPAVSSEDYISQVPEPTDLPETLEPTEIPTPTPEPIDYEVVQPNESGEIPIVMFHNFIDDLNDTTDNFYTTTFNDFEQLLETLYNKGYRLISMQDFIDHDISVPAGKMPMVFSFDDGSPGQFNLIEEDGSLVVNPKSAVGAMLKFNEKHPDFGLEGIFYLNMDLEENTFEGAGMIKERIDILLSYGFEIGNHSWGHFDFSTAQSTAQINEKLGKNQKRLKEIMGDNTFYSLALPFGGRPPEAFRDAMVTGTFEGVDYRNDTIMAVGAQPSIPSIHTSYDPTYVGRIRAQGKVQEDFDLTYWLPKMTKERMYISDGDPNTVVIPTGMESKINTEKLNNKKLITY